MDRSDLVCADHSSPVKVIIKMKVANVRAIKICLDMPHVIKGIGKDWGSQNPSVVPRYDIIKGCQR